MNRKYLIIFLALTLVFSLTSCNSSSHDEIEEDDSRFTIKYINEKYVPQLLKDGAEYYFGNIVLKDSKEDEENIFVGVDVKVIVERENGAYYLENSNQYKEFSMSKNAKCTYATENVSVPQVLSAEDCLKAYNKEIEKKGETYAESKFFDIYVMNDEAVLLVEHILPSESVVNLESQ